LVFLPFYLTHVLQPFDLLYFCPQITKLAYINDIALIKKHRFIKYYYRAREEGLTARVIKSR
ncbi:uncharacterized protein K441DRAFT_546568, partial [Cenococcum geophilum 1.58]|uniref:uncharacterized protein n=1 Tax=Cenococcum geophilum 1.58 TaxID=794803 RepID=UPI00358FD3DC